MSLKTIKPFSSNKVQSSDRVIPSEIVIKRISKRAKKHILICRKKFQYFKLRKYDPLSGNIDHLTLKAIVKWRTNRSSILQYKGIRTWVNVFFFNFISKEGFFKKIKILNNSKVVYTLRKRIQNVPRFLNTCQQSIYLSKKLYFLVLNYILKYKQPLFQFKNLSVEDISRTKILCFHFKHLPVKKRIKKYSKT